MIEVLPELPRTSSVPAQVQYDGLAFTGDAGLFRPHSRGRTITANVRGDTLESVTRAVLDRWATWGTLTARRGDAEPVRTLYLALRSPSVGVAPRQAEGYVRLDTLAGSPEALAAAERLARLVAGGLSLADALADGPTAFVTGVELEAELEGARAAFDRARARVVSGDELEAELEAERRDDDDDEPAR